MSMGGIRQQYSVLCNIALARYGVDFYAHFDEVMAGTWGIPQAHFHQRGYLILLHASNHDALQRRYEVQRQLGVEVELLSPEEVRELVPHLWVADILGGIYGRRDGYLNPRGALQGFVERSRELGCTWLQDEVSGFTPDAASHAAVQDATTGSPGRH
jgi:glycine/D-amino acid oxidase-like deaminating enzyme